MATTHLMKRGNTMVPPQHHEPAPQPVVIPPHELPEWKGSDFLPEKAQSFEFTHNVTGDFKGDYETVCGLIGIPLHPALLRSLQQRREKQAAAAEIVDESGQTLGKDPLTEINIRGFKLDRATSFALAHALKPNTQITKISLYRNFLTNDSLNHIILAAGVCNSLHSLSIDWNESADITDYMIPFLSSSSCRLKALSLRANKLTDDHAIRFGDVLKVNASLLSLSLYHNQIGDIGASALAEGLIINKSLLSLNLSENAITSTGARSLAEALSRIVLPEDVSEQLTRKKAEIEAELARNKKKPVEKDPKKNQKKPVKKSEKDEPTKEVDMDSNEFIEGRWYRKGNRTLVSLNISRNPVGALGAASLNDVRLVNEVLSRLAMDNLTGNDFGEPEAPVVFDDPENPQEFQ